VAARAARASQPGQGFFGGSKNIFWGIKKMRIQRLAQAAQPEITGD
jgi:hypothetical protein